MGDVTFLPHYFRTLDETPLEVFPLLAPDFRFSFLWSTGDEAREFAGGLEEYEGYMRQREPDGQLHHIGFGTREGRREVVTGWTTKNREPLASFTFAVELDEQDRAKRLFAARTLVFGGQVF
jgi:hypothetical protein